VREEERQNLNRLRKTELRRTAQLTARVRAQATHSSSSHNGSSPESQRAPLAQVRKKDDFFDDVFFFSLFFPLSRSLSRARFCACDRAF
jgi:hypothetical protein